jgi:hypothetical protein
MTPASAILAALLLLPAASDPPADGAQQSTQSTITSVPAGQVTTFADASTKGSDPEAFTGRWIRIVTETHPEGIVVLISAFDPATGTFTLHDPLPAGTFRANDTYTVAAFEDASGAFPGFAALSTPSTTTTLTADRFTGIVVPGGAGAGGADGSNAFFFATFNPAGDGAPGATGGDLSRGVDFGPFNIFTAGQIGIRASSTGGDGGDGGNNVTLITAKGGDGGRGGNGGSVFVQTTSTTGGIFTAGSGATGILATSRGGDGGDGGNANTGFVGEGGRGGFGGNGGSVRIDANTAIQTTGLNAHGIFGQSLGGNGGSGGDGGGLVSGGGDASGSGNAGRVDIVNTGSISTFGPRAFGIFSQSIGGFAGTGGTAFGFVTFGGDPTSGGNAAVATIDNSGSIATHGLRSHGLFAQSIGGNGGAAGLESGNITLGASGADGGHASTVRIDNTGAITATGLFSRGIVAQSIGGGGGDAGGADGLLVFGGSGGAGGSAGQAVVTNTGAIATTSDAIFAQSIGGGGGSGSGSGNIGAVAIGGTGGGGGHGSSVTVTNSGTLTSGQTGARGIVAQSIGGGGGDGGFSGGLVAIGGRGGTPSHGGAVTVENTGLVSAPSSAIFAQSVGGGGGSGGLTGGWFSFGGTGGGGGNAGIVTVTNHGALASLGSDSSALVAQSIGGGGGSGSGSISLGAFLSAGVGGTGGAGGDGRAVVVTSDAPLIATAGARSHGIFAQSVGGGGGNGGFAGSASAGYIISASIGKGGTGAVGGSGGTVHATAGGNITTLGVDAAGVFAQSIGGGGGNGGWTISATGSDTASVGLAFGGAAGGGGRASAVVVDTTGGYIATGGVRAHGLFAQSLGGGGGNGGFSVAAAGSGVGSGTLSMGGSGGSGGAGDSVTVSNAHDITTLGLDAIGLFAQSVGGGGGNGGINLAGAGAGSAAGALTFGASGGDGGSGGIVTVTSAGTLDTFGEAAVGLFAQSIGGGGGRGSFNISGAGAGTGSGSVAVGGIGGGGGDAAAVTVQNDSIIRTRGLEAHGLFAQSVGGGGGYGGFSLAGSGAGTGSGSVAVGGAGGDGGSGRSVDVTHRGSIETWGGSAIGLFAQSVGGGGGTGGFSIAGSGAGTGSGTFNLGGFGGGGGSADRVGIVSDGAITTHGADAYGLFAQSVGGGGGNGGFSLTGSGAGTGSGTAGIGGFGGIGGVSGIVDATNRGSIETSGIAAIGLFAQSVGGGGGSGRFSIAGSGAGTGSGSLSIGGAGGGGGQADRVWAVSDGTILTRGDEAIGLLAQSVGGGGGTGGFSLTGSGAGTGSGSLGIGGFGGDGGNGLEVDVTTLGSIVTFGNDAAGVLAQSVGGGGGNGRFSIAGSGAKSGSGTFSLGGAGGGGGSAGAVTITSAATIATAGQGSYGISAQSVGGGGGSGGFSFAGGVTTSGGQLNAGVGGFGGAGGSGGQVTLTHQGTVLTAGGGSHGVMLQSVGGGGGAGGFAGSLSATGGQKPNVSLGIGGWGGVGGDGGAVSLTNDVASHILTQGFAAHAVLAQSIGGGGGDGGGAFAISFDVTSVSNSKLAIGVGGALGGFGGAAGDAGTVDVVNQAALTTTLARSHGIFAQSVGGGGGTGGFSATGVLGMGTGQKDFSVSVGGAGGAGGVGAAVDVENTGAISVLGGSASGIFAQSVGGGGGDGGFSFAGSFAAGAVKDAAVAVGGFGGDGNAGGAVTVINGGAIDIAADMTPEIIREALAASPLPLTPEQQEELLATLYTTRPAPGIVAQSIGGGGGNGGNSLALGLSTLGEKKSWDLTGVVAVGGMGGEGNTGGRVEVTNTAAITTRDVESDGILLQSVGGGGGRGGTSHAGVASLAFADGHSLSTNVSVGGFGGSGNMSDEAVAVNSGDILTLGDQSAGVRAQSIGGGGGLGGSARGGTYMFDVSRLNSSNPGEDIKVQVSVGGNGGAGNDGRAARITNSGTIETRGGTAHGLVAQSIGGGGGSGGDSLDGLGTSADNLLEWADKGTGFVSDFRNSLGTKIKDKLKSFISEWSIAVGGNAGSSGDGAAASITNSGSVTTSGFGSHAIFAQSVGGGGGEGTGTLSGESAGGKAESGFEGKVGIGGAGGAAGDGGAVDVINSATLTTGGNQSYGIFAQSVGGGGGVAGNVERVLPEDKEFKAVGLTIPGLNIGLGLDFGRDGGGAGDGGGVTVTNTAGIFTSGDGATGIFAQSVGGGGGLAGGIGLLSQAASSLGAYNFAGSVGGDGSGGAVTVTQIGDIVTSGGRADGIFAQSAGGTALGGAVTVDLTGSIFAIGVESHGIFAQSRGDAGAGDITVTLRGGAVVGGFGAPAVALVEGRNNRIDNVGVLSTTRGIFGTTVTGTTGDEVLGNAGTLVGSIDLGSGVNAFTNTGRFDAGSLVRIGAGNLFTNAGLLSPGGAGRTFTTTLDGHLFQSGAPAWLVDLGEIGVSDTLGVLGRYQGGAAATLDLNMLAQPAGSGLYTLMTANGGGLDDTTFRFGSLFGEMPLGRTFELAASNTVQQLALVPSTGSFYWTGATSPFWSAPFVTGQSNWTRTAAGNYVYGTPGAATDVVMLPTAGASALGAHFSINSLGFAGGAGGTPVNIVPGHSLTLGGTQGISVDSTGPGAAIGVDLVLGADQVWRNDATLDIYGSAITGAGRDLTIAGSGTTVIDAAIETGGGSLTKEGSGTLFLTGTNDYTGGTFVSAGAVAGSTGSLQGAIVNDAVVAFDQRADGSYTGTMSGSGSLFKLGDATLTLSGPNSYSGGTWIAAGTLRGSANSIQGDILNESTLVFDQPDAGTYAGSLQGSGLFNKLGAGALTMTGNSSPFTGATVVGAGGLYVDGWLGGSSILVQPGATLGGTGLVTSTTIVGGGTLAPGNSIGTLGVLGNVRFSIGSNFSVETAPDGSSDVTVATGSLAIDGGSVNVLATGSGYLPITRYPILSAQGGITGTFDGVTSTAPFLNPTLDYQNELLLLTLRRTDVDFAVTGASGSAGEVARVLTALVPSADGEMGNLVNHVFQLPDADAVRSMRSLAGGIYQQVASAALDGSRMFMAHSLERSGRGASLDPPVGGSGPRPAVANLTGAQGLRHPGTAQPSGWWIRGIGGTATLAGDGTDPGASVPTRGIAIGFDRALTSRLSLGVSGARTNPEVRQASSNDHTTSRALHLGGYGSYRFGSSRVNAAFAAGHQEHRTRREVFLAGDPLLAGATYDGRSYAAQLEFRHRFDMTRGLGFETAVGMQAGGVSFDALSEEGAGAVNLLVRNRRMESYRSLVGGTLYRTIGATSRPRAVLEARAAWAHEFNPRGGMPVRFAGDTSTPGFQIAPSGVARDSALLGAGLYARTWQHLRLFADVASEVGGELRTISGTFGFGWQW